MAQEFVVTGNFLKKRRIRQYDRLKKIFCGGKGLRQAPRWGHGCRSQSITNRYKRQSPREPLNNSLRTQRGLKGAAVVFCRDGQGGSLS